MAGGGRLFGFFSICAVSVVQPYFQLAKVLGDSKCVLPQMEKPINWNMLPGTWYVMQNTRDPLAEVTPCYSVANIRQIPGDGVYVEFRDIRSVSDTGDPNYDITPVHWLPYGNTYSTYRLDEDCESLWIDEIAEFSATSDVKTTITAISEVNNFFHIPFVLFTDYKHFWASLQCVGDKRLVWTHTRHPHPSDEEKLRAKALAKIGDGWDEVQLYPSGCTRFDIPDPIINT